MSHTSSREADLRGQRFTAFVIASVVTTVIVFAMLMFGLSNANGPSYLRISLSLILISSVWCAFAKSCLQLYRHRRQWRVA